MVGTLRAIFINKEAALPTHQQGIDRAIREYARTHLAEESVNATSAQEAAVHEVGVPPSGDDRALEQFLAYIKEVAQRVRSTHQREIKLVHREELWTFRLSILAAIMALVIVATGGGLLFAEKIAVGTITAL